MSNEEELRRTLLRYRRLLFLRYRFLHSGDLDGALNFEQNAQVSDVEKRLRAASWPENPSPGLKRLAGQCSRWTERCAAALDDLKRRAGGMLFRERADEEIKNFLQKMFLREP